MANARPTTIRIDLTPTQMRCIEAAGFVPGSGNLATWLTERAERAERAEEDDRVDFALKMLTGARHVRDAEGGEGLMDLIHEVREVLMGMGMDSV